jgi:hypothetical protein
MPKMKVAGPRLVVYYVLFTPASGNSLQPLSLLPSMSFVFLIDTYGVLVIPYVLASSSPRCPHRSKRPNQPRGFRVFFWSLQVSILFRLRVGEGGVILYPTPTLLEPE